VQAAIDAGHTPSAAAAAGAGAAETLCEIIALDETQSSESQDEAVAEAGAEAADAWPSPEPVCFVDHSSLFDIESFSVKRWKESTKRVLMPDAGGDPTQAAASSSQSAASSSQAAAGSSREEVHHSILAALDDLDSKLLTLELTTPP